MEKTLEELWAERLSQARGKGGQGGGGLRQPAAKVGGKAAATNGARGPSQGILAGGSGISKVMRGIRRSLADAAARRGGAGKGKGAKGRWSSAGGKANGKSGKGGKSGKDMGKGKRSGKDGKDSGKGKSIGKDSGKGKSNGKDGSKGKGKGKGKGKDESRRSRNYSYGAEPLSRKGSAKGGEWAGGGGWKGGAKGKGRRATGNAASDRLLGKMGASKSARSKMASRDARNLTGRLLMGVRRTIAKNRPERAGPAPGRGRDGVDRGRAGGGGGGGYGKAKGKGKGPAAGAMLALGNEGRQARGREARRRA